MSDLDRKEIDRLKEKLAHAVVQRDQAKEQRDRHKAWSATAMEQRDALQTEVWALQAQMNALREEMNALRASAARSSDGATGPMWPPVEPRLSLRTTPTTLSAPKLPSFVEGRFQRVATGGAWIQDIIVRPKGKHTGPTHRMAHSCRVVGCGPWRNA